MLKVLAYRPVKMIFFKMIKDSKKPGQETLCDFASMLHSLAMLQREHRAIEAETSISASVLHTVCLF